MFARLACTLTTAPRVSTRPASSPSPRVRAELMAAGRGRSCPSASAAGRCDARRGLAVRLLRGGASSVNKLLALSAEIVASYRIRISSTKLAKAPSPSDPSRLTPWAETRNHRATSSHRRLRRTTRRRRSATQSSTACSWPLVAEGLLPPRTRSRAVLRRASSSLSRRASSSRRPCLTSTRRRSTRCILGLSKHGDNVLWQLQGAPRARRLPHLPDISRLSQFSSEDGYWCSSYENNHAARAGRMGRPLPQPEDDACRLGRSPARRRLGAGDVLAEGDQPDPGLLQPSRRLQRGDGAAESAQFLGRRPRRC